MDMKKNNHTFLKILLVIFSLAWPVVGVLYFNQWVNMIIVYIIEAFLWLAFIFFTRQNNISQRELEEQANSMDDILKLAYDKCMESRNANMAKSNFLAQMSHEIRTPINAILGMNEMILRESDDEKVTEYASNAYSAGKALLSIINDILDISKIEAGKLEIVQSDYELYSLVSDCYYMTFDRAEKKGLRFSYYVDETLPSRFLGDMYHIRQIVVNFVTNAIKYTDEGSVELSFVKEETDDGFALKVSVRDSGIGLTDEDKEKLFTSFTRFDLKRNQTVEGTGLGLSICKNLAELMGGQVFVQSEYGKGSTFGCIIPQTVIDDTPVGTMIITHNAGVAEGIEGKHFTAEAARILVVDDVDMNITVFKSLLKGHKMNIDSALSGQVCLNMVRERKYDLIFMDHMMPEMDGMETYAHMKEIEHLNKETPVIMLTANAISGEKEKYMNAGFASYLTKPIVSDKLDEVLITYLPEEKIRWEDVPEKETKQKELSEDELLSFRKRIKEAAEAFDDEEIALVLDELSGYTYHEAELLDKFNGVRELAKNFECEKAGDLAEKVFEALGAGVCL